MLRDHADRPDKKPAALFFGRRFLYQRKPKAVHEGSKDLSDNFSPVFPRLPHWIRITDPGIGSFINIRMQSQLHPAACFARYGLRPVSFLSEEREGDRSWAGIGPDRRSDGSDLQTFLMARIQKRGIHDVLPEKGIVKPRVPETKRPAEIDSAHLPDELGQHIFGIPRSACLTEHLYASLFDREHRLHPQDMNSIRNQAEEIINAEIIYT